ncbi:MAG: sigma-54 dependent transcriptional regulator [Pirellulales bacterium]|nr:sigma-54 dependent transcriptional regulator [Pirellulales bacterium]
MSKLLVVDDEQSICWGLSRLGTSIGHDVYTASSAEHALELARDTPPDLIVLDVRLPGMDGISAIERFRESVGNVPIIVMTAYGDLNTAIRAVRQGAFEYILKPFDLETVERAVKRALVGETNEVAGQQTQQHVGGIVGTSHALQQVFKQIALAATSEAAVLLCGESGTGKELAARAIHQFSDRAQRPFVAVNVASLSASLAESELFGHRQGSFTGADQDRQGLLVQADGGTLFLDEIADIPLPTQVKLLRALEHGEVTPVGANAPVKTDFRILSATHQDLLTMSKEGVFRHDLYFRLAAFRIEIPPLRERREDIEALAKYFLLAAAERGAPQLSLSEAAITELRQRPWYGNVRELRNVMEHAMIVARGGVIEPEHLPQPIAASQIMPATADSSLEESIAALISRWAKMRLEDSPAEAELQLELSQLVEPPLYKEALEKHRGQCAAAARRLGLHRTTLKKKLDDYGISDE